MMLCIIFSITAMSACDKKIYITTGLKSNEIFKLSGKPCELAEVLLVLMTEKSRYEEDLGADIWSADSENTTMSLEQEIKQKVKMDMTELKTVEKFADSKEVKLSEEELEKLSSAADEFMNSIDENTKSALNVTKENVESLYTSFYKATKVYNMIADDNAIEISDEEARVIEVMYIFVATCNFDTDGNKIEYTEEQMAEAEAKVENIKALIETGNDFSVVANEYSENDTIIGTYARGETVQEFEEVAFNMQSGETSKEIKTDKGYYFIYCKSDYLVNETNAKKIEMEEKHKKEAYEALFTPFKSEQTFEFNDDVWDEVKLENYAGISTSSLYDIYNKWMEVKTAKSF